MAKISWNSSIHQFIPKNSMPKIIDKEARKKEILMIALNEFAVKGVQNTRMVDIAKAANIGKGTIYEYFRSKEEIFDSANDLIFSDLHQFIMKELAKATCPEEKIMAFVMGAIKGLESHAEIIQIHLDFWAEGLRSESLQKTRTIYIEMHSMLTGFIQEGMDQGIFQAADAKQLAWGIAAFMDGLVFQKCVFGSDFEIQNKAEANLQILLNGLKKR